MFPPVKRVYESQLDYYRVMLPIVQYEWHQSSSSIRQASTVPNAAVNGLSVVQNFPPSEPGATATSLVSMDLLFPYSINNRVWQPENSNGIQEVHLFFVNRVVLC